VRTLAGTGSHKAAFKGIFSGGFLPGVYFPGGFLPGGFLPGGFFPGGFFPEGYFLGGFYPVTQFQSTLQIWSLLKKIEILGAVGVLLDGAQSRYEILLPSLVSVYCASFMSRWALLSGGGSGGHNFKVL